MTVNLSDPGFEQLQNAISSDLWLALQKTYQNSSTFSAAFDALISCQAEATCLAPATEPLCIHAMAGEIYPIQ